jgi:hypothetical protein
VGLVGTAWSLKRKIKRRRETVTEGKRERERGERNEEREMRREK